MSRSAVTAVAVVVLLGTMVAVWGVGEGRQVASAGPAPVVTPVPPPAPTETPAATEPSRPTTLPTSTTTVSGNATSSGNATRPPPTTAATTTTATPVPDYDGDGIPDDRDACPTRPETVNGFQDGDGCPDVVATTGAS